MPVRAEKRVELPLDYFGVHGRHNVLDGDVPVLFELIEVFNEVVVLLLLQLVHACLHVDSRPDKEVELGLNLRLGEGVLHLGVDEAPEGV